METLERSVDQQFWNIVAELENTGFEPSDLLNLNNWQRISEATNHVVTPANAIDAVAFAGAMYGLNELDSWKGIMTTCASFMADFVDGKVARATGTQSALGEAVDVTGDKIKLAFGLYKIWKLGLAPKPLILTIAAQNGINVALTAVDRSVNKQDPLIHPSQFGKKAIFMQQWALGLHVIGSEVSKQNEKRGRMMKLAGNVLGAAGVVVGAAATAGYAKILFSSGPSVRHH